MLVKIRNEFQSKKAPEISQANVGANGPELDGGVKREWTALGHEACKRVTVEMISMSRVCGPIGIRIMRSDYLDAATGFCNAVKFAHK